MHATLCGPAAPVHTPCCPHSSAQTASWRTRSRHTELQSIRCSARAHATRAMHPLSHTLVLGASLCAFGRHLRQGPSHWCGAARPGRRPQQTLTSRRVKWRVLQSCASTPFDHTLLKSSGRLLSPSFSGRFAAKRLLLAAKSPKGRGFFLPERGPASRRSCRYQKIHNPTGNPLFDLEFQTSRLHIFAWPEARSAVDPHHEGLMRCETLARVARCFTLEFHIGTPARSS